jgi:MFS family permease
MVMIGLAYSIYVSAIWPMIPYVVDAKVVGTAYGLTTAIQNIGMGFGPNLIGLVQDKTEGYSTVSLTFALMTGVGIVTAFLLLFLDYMKIGGKLQAPAKDEGEST